MGLFGSYHVKPTGGALRDAWNLLPNSRDFFELRRQTLKLAYWPGGELDHSGQVCDMNWDRIVGMEAPKANELRIEDKIGGFDNLRVIFYVAEVKRDEDELPAIWVLKVMQKKTERFSNNDLKIFKALVKIVRVREYGMKH